MDKQIAEEILTIAEEEMTANKGIGYKFAFKLEGVLKKIGKDCTDYIYPEGNKYVFNSRRWKRDFLGGK